MNEASDDGNDDESAEEIFLDKPNSSYSKLVGLLQVNKKRKVGNKIEEDIDKVDDKVDIIKSDLGNEEEEMKKKTGLQRGTEKGEGKKGKKMERGEEKESERREGKNEKEKGKVEVGNSEDDDEGISEEEEENEKGKF